MQQVVPFGTSSRRISAAGYRHSCFPKQQLKAVRNMGFCNFCRRRLVDPGPLADFVALPVIQVRGFVFKAIVSEWWPVSQKNVFKASSVHVRHHWSLYKYFAPHARVEKRVGDGEAARHDAFNRVPLQTAAAFAVNLARQANRKGGKRAGAAQQP